MPDHIRKKRYYLMDVYNMISLEPCSTCTLEYEYAIQNLRIFCVAVLSKLSALKSLLT